MTTEFKATHLLSITVGGETSHDCVAVVDAEWDACEPGPGAQLVTREEWDGADSPSYTLDDDGRLCCNGDAHGWGNGEWSLVALSDAGQLGAEHGAEDRAHDDGEVCDDDGVAIPAAPRARIAWASDALARDYRTAYAAERGA